MQMQAHVQIGHGCPKKDIIFYKFLWSTASPPRPRKTMLSCSAFSGRSQVKQNQPPLASNDQGVCVSTLLHIVLHFLTNPPVQKKFIFWSGSIKVGRSAPLPPSPKVQCWGDWSFFNSDWPQTDEQLNIVFRGRGGEAVPAKKWIFFWTPVSD